MTQAYLGQLDGATDDGSDVVTAWNAFDTAYKSGQLDTTRPTGITRGGLWTRDNGDGTETLMLYDGSADVPIAAGAEVTAAVAGLFTEADGDIQTDGTHSYRQIGDCLECWGTATTAAGGEVIVTYPSAFGATPRVLVSAKIPSLVTRNAAFDNSYGGSLLTTFRAVGYNTETGAGTAVAFDWYAIGEGA